MCVFHIFIYILSVCLSICRSTSIYIQNPDDLGGAGMHMSGQSLLASNKIDRLAVFCPPMQPLFSHPANRFKHGCGSNHVKPPCVALMNIP